MNVGIIGDTHIKASRPGYLEFCSDTFEEYKVDTIIHIGDLVDWASVSFHSKQPDLPGTADEFELAYAGVQKWGQRFPNVKWCIGNHDDRPVRLAATVNIADFMLVPYNELFDLPGWEMSFKFKLDNTLYKHGTTSSGIHPAWNRMNKAKMNIVIGHCHSRAGVKWSMNEERRFFCMDVGCGINEKEFNFTYAKETDERPVLACGVVEDGQPHSIAMKCGRGEKYHDSRFVDPNKPRPKYLGKHFLKHPTPEAVGKFGNKQETGGRKRDPAVPTVHFSAQYAYDVACMPGGPVDFTFDKSKVTCGNCKRTKIFKESK